MDRTTGEVAYRAARDILVRHRDDWDAAVAAFRWPDIADRFNWALDWLDPVAAGNLRTALRIIGEDGTDRSYSFAEMAARSDRLATSLAADGVAPGDQVDKSAEIPGDFDRIALGDAPAPWRPYRLADTVAPPSRPGAQTGADDSMLIYFTSGTTSRPKLVQHMHRSYPVGHLSTILVQNYPRFDASRFLTMLRQAGGVGTRSGHRGRDLRPCPPQPCALPAHPADRIHGATQDDLRQDPACRPAGS